MKRRKFTEVQIAFALKQSESGRPCRRGVPEAGRHPAARLSGIDPPRLHDYAFIRCCISNPWTKLRGFPQYIAPSISKLFHLHFSISFLLLYYRKQTMKNFGSIILLILIVLHIASCKSVYIFKQNSLNGSPCGEADSGVNVRIKNMGTIPFSKFEIGIDGRYYEFSGLEPGRVTCFKNVPYIWSNNSYKIWFYSSRKDGKIRIFQPVDHVGETQYKKGFLTLNVRTSGTVEEPGKTSLSISVYDN